VVTDTIIELQRWQHFCLVSSYLTMALLLSKDCFTSTFKKTAPFKKEGLIKIWSRMV